MSLPQSVPDDEIAAEFAASWGDDDDWPAELISAAGRAEARPADRASLSPARVRPGDPQDVHEAAARVRPVSLALEQVLPVAPALAGLLPAGLPRGSTVLVGGGSATDADADAGGGGATALALALAARASADGSWVAAVGVPQIGLAAAAELGVALERFAVIGAPPVERWATVTGALLGAFDVVFVTPPPTVRAGEVRRLVARARERGSVLIHLAAATAAGRPVVGKATGPAALGADLRFTITAARWGGLGAGHGHLVARRVTVELAGRRGAARPRQVDLWLPDAAGRLAAIDLGAEVTTLPVVSTSISISSSDGGRSDDRDGRLVIPAAAAVSAVPAAAVVPVVPAAAATDLVLPAAAADPAVAGYAGSDIDHLVDARRARLRRLARAPVTPPDSGDDDASSSGEPATVRIAHLDAG